MPPEAEKYLVDIQAALAEIRNFTRGMDLKAYRADAKSRAAVERKFEVVGEACVRLREKAPDLYARIPDAAMVVGFRNRLIHGYDDIDDGIVWDIVHRKLPQFAAEIDRLVAQFKK
jgi:uncharacterized protein with HEPN domain